MALPSTFVRTLIHRRTGDPSFLRSCTRRPQQYAAVRRFRAETVAQAEAGEGGRATAPQRDAGAGASTRDQGASQGSAREGHAHEKSHKSHGHKSSHRLKGGCTIEELTSSARVAKLCDFIYSPELAGPVRQEGYTFITEGFNKHTRWFLADETRPDGRITRHIIMRGVVWGSDQVDRVSLMQRVANVWPRHVAEGTSRILCHSGVLSIAEEVWEAVLPYIRGRPRDSQLLFAGHSLGGSLALMLTVFARIRLGIAPEGLLPTHMFGSPPVISLTTADTAASQSASVVHDGHEILRELQLPESAVRWFVADQDIVPRLWNAADPVYAYVRRSSALVRVLQWREQVFGGPMLTEQKFLYDMLGRIYWIKWPRNEGVKVLRMTPEQAEVELKEHPEDVIQPSALFRSAMDHSRRNYSFALDTLVVLHRRGV